jgi:hypothetical protein
MGVAGDKGPELPEAEQPGERSPRSSSPSPEPVEQDGAGV